MTSQGRFLDDVLNLGHVTANPSLIFHRLTMQCVVLSF